MVSISNKKHIYSSDHESAIAFSKELNKQFKGEHNVNELVTFEVDDSLYITREYASKTLLTNAYRFSLDEEKTILEPYGPYIYVEDDLSTIYKMKFLSKVGLLSKEYTFSYEPFADSVKEAFRELTLNSDGVSYSSRTRLIVDSNLSIFGNGYRILIKDSEDSSIEVELLIWPADCCFMVTYRCLTAELGTSTPELYGDTNTSLDKIVDCLIENIIQI